MLYEELQQDAQVAELLKKGNRDLGVLGFTDHSVAHTTLVAERAAYILRKLGYSEREQELAKIAGLLHDIGNSVNRTHHAEYGALLAWDIPQGQAPDPGGAGDGYLCHRQPRRVHRRGQGPGVGGVGAGGPRPTCGGTGSREKEREKFDIHDRVNFAVTGSSLKVDPEEAKISLNLQVDESICTMYEYFDIFLGRMMMCGGPQRCWGAKFRLTVNGGKVL